MKSNGLLFRALVARDVKIFFKDKGVFFPSLLAPLILLFLFIAFLGNVYRDSIRSVPFGEMLSDNLVESIAAGWLLSSLLAVCAVTIAFTANTVMVQDRVSGVSDDFAVSPAPASLVALAYFVSTYLVTAFICLVAMGAGLIYIAAAGWHLTAADLFLSVLDTALLVLFGTALSSVVCHFLHSQGGVTAVEATVSAAYGFLCGAYMPLSSLADWLCKTLSFLPGTYGTSLLHLHLMGSAIDAVTQEGLPAELAEGLKSGFDCSVTFFGNDVPVWTSYLVLAGSVLLLVLVYILLCSRRRKREA